MAPLLFQRLDQLARILFWLPVKLVPALLLTLPKASSTLAYKLGLHAWDAALLLGNSLTPQLKRGTVVKPSKPGYKGFWPPFIEPTESDSRAPCPGLSESFLSPTLSR